MNSNFVYRICEVAAAGARAMLERLLENVHVTRTLPAAFGGGQLVATTRAGGLKYVFKSPLNIDPQLLDSAQRFVKSGDVVWDIGANVGLFTLAASFFAGKSGRVFAFEADPYALSLLYQTCIGIGADRSIVKVVSCAVSDIVGRGEFHFSRRSASSNHLSGFGQSQTGGTRFTGLVPLSNIDSLAQALPAPNVVKIDVEGAELLVLRGGGNTIAAHRPVVIVEIAAINAIATRLVFSNLDYRCFDADDPNCEEVFSPKTPWNAVFIPKEKVGGFFAASH